MGEASLSPGLEAVKQKPFRQERASSPLRGGLLGEASLSPGLEAIKQTHPPYVGSLSAQLVLC